MFKYFRLSTRSITFWVSVLSGCMTFASQSQAGLIRLDYSGTIYSAGAGNSVGDIVSGFLLMDTSLAPPNGSPWEPNIGSYDGRTTSPQFVTSGKEPPTNATTSLSDFVSITSAPGTVFSWSERVAIRDGEVYDDGIREEILIDLKFASFVDVLVGNSINQNYVGLNDQPLGRFDVPGGVDTSFIMFLNSSYADRESLASVDIFRFTDCSQFPGGGATGGEFPGGGATGGCFPTQVPEPSILALMGIGIAGLVFARRRKI